jgi:hypothetical protein
MKIRNLFLILMSSSSLLMACNVLNTGSQETVNQRFAREQREQKEVQAQRQAEERAKASQAATVQYAGGQPGKISVNGVAVSHEGSHTLLDRRIKVTQTAGESDKTKHAPLATIAATALPSFSEKKDSSLQSLAQDKTYVAFGCNQVLDAHLTEGLQKKEVSQLTEHATAISAHTVFLCGRVKWNNPWTTISAHELVLVGATALMKGSTGQLSLLTEHLVLVGKNKIQTLGLNAAREVPAAPSLELTVLSAIDGEGSLELSSVGGNCSAK